MKTISNFIYDDSDFENEDYYQVVCCELINDSASEFEVLDKIDLIRTALYPTCEIYKELSMLRPRIKSYLKKIQMGF